MSDTVSISKTIYKNKKLKDFDIRLYLIIIEHVNELGYSKITNDTLTHFTGKKEMAIQRAIKSLEKEKFIQVKYRVKKNEIYDDSSARVIWRIEKYRQYHWGKRNASSKNAPKSKENDFKLFLEFLRTDCKNLPFPIDMGGLVQTYIIHDDKLLWLHAKDETPRLLDMYDSSDVYKRMFSKRKAIFAHMSGIEESLSMQQLTRSANEKRNDDG